ncbi:hypothetical protein MMC10_006060 [Thelotrema lepadinum]|nr:hypothetical protein [Thelotrema lepadinum]
MQQQKEFVRTGNERAGLPWDERRPHLGAGAGQPQQQYAPAPYDPYQQYPPAPYDPYQQYPPAPYDPYQQTHPQPAPPSSGTYPSTYGAQSAYTQPAAPSHGFGDGAWNQGTGAAAAAEPARFPPAPGPDLQRIAIQSLLGSPSGSPGPTVPVAGTTRRRQQTSSGSSPEESVPEHQTSKQVAKRNRR